MEKLPRFSYLLQAQPCCAAVGSWQIPQRSEPLGWALLCPSASTFCPPYTHRAPKNTAPPAFATGYIHPHLYLSSQTRHCKEKWGRKHKASFSTTGSIWDSRSGDADKEFWFSTASEEMSHSSKAGNLPFFWASGLPSSICIALEIKNSSSAGLQLHFNGAAGTDNKPASVYGPLLLQTS